MRVFSRVMSWVFSANARRISSPGTSKANVATPFPSTLSRTNHWPDWFITVS